MNPRRSNVFRVSLPTPAPCAVCGEPVTQADVDAGQVAPVGTAACFVVAHLRHFWDDAGRTINCSENLRKLAQAHADKSAACEKGTP